MIYRKKDKSKQTQLQMLCIEDLVPQDHMLREIEVNIAYRWFIGYDLTEPIPHFSTFGKNYKRRFEGTDIFERIFRHIFEEAVTCGFVDASAIFIDGTHIRANANKKVKEIVAIEAKRYREELDAEIERDRKEHGKKPLKDKKDQTTMAMTADL